MAPGGSLTTCRVGAGRGQGMDEGACAKYCSLARLGYTGDGQAHIREVLLYREGIGNGRGRMREACLSVL